MKRNLRSQVLMLVHRLILIVILTGLLFFIATSSVKSAESRYVYDDLGRLIRVERPDGIVITYTYDTVGNRLSKKVIHDRDYDDVPDSIDNCLTVPNTNQADTDSDNVGDACDNCPNNPNPGQENDDGDKAGNVCDCAPNDATAFAIPFEIRNLRFLSDKSTIEWDTDAPNSGSGTIYDFMKGNISELPVGSGSPGAEICIECGSIDTQYQDASTPDLESGYYYLVRGKNICDEGTYGKDSSNNERMSSACPEICP